MDKATKERLAEQKRARTEVNKRTAILRTARISPQKCRLVADMVRGQPVGRALATLRYTPKKGARIVLKVLESAVANAENNHNADIDALKVARIEVNEAPTFKRFHARAMKRFSVGPSSTVMVAIFSSSTSAPALFSALAMADSTTFLIM